MGFNWNNPSLSLNSKVLIGDIEALFEGPFAVRLMPDTSRFAAQARYFKLGMRASDILPRTRGQA